MTHVAGGRVPLLMLIVGDTLLVAFAIAIALWIRLGVLLWDVSVLQQDGVGVLLIVAVVQTCLVCSRCYDREQFANRTEAAKRVVQALASSAFIIAFLYYWFPRFILGRGVFLIASVLSICLLLGWRIVLFRPNRPRHVLNTAG